MNSKSAFSAKSFVIGSGLGACLIAGLTVAGCSTALQPTSPLAGASPISTSAIKAPAGPPAKPVAATKAKQMYVWAAFKEADCSAVAPALTVSKAPAKGAVTFKQGEQIVIQHSQSGKCLGQTVAGTGIYYTGNAGQFGDDSFTISATTPSGGTGTRSFRVDIVE